MCPGNNPYSGGNNINPFGVSNPYNAKNSFASGGEQPIDMKNNPYAKKSAAQSQEQYLRQRIETASKGELTLMLFEGCCKFLNRAEKAFEIRETSDDVQEKIKMMEEINTNLLKAQNILLELMSSLNFDYDISHKLYPVYNYLYRELVRINFAKDGKALPPVIKILEDYHETWKEVVKKDRKNQYANGQNGSFA